MDKFEQAFERIKVQGHDLAEKIRELIHEGNVRRIIVKDERGHTYVEIPLTVASIGVIAAPVLAAVGAIAALVAKFDIVVERAPAGAHRPGRVRPRPMPAWAPLKTRWTCTIPWRSASTPRAQTRGPRRHGHARFPGRLS